MSSSSQKIQCQCQTSPHSVPRFEKFWSMHTRMFLTNFSGPYESKLNALHFLTRAHIRKKMMLAILHIRIILPWFSLCVLGLRWSFRGPFVATLKQPIKSLPMFAPKHGVHARGLAIQCCQPKCFWILPFFKMTNCIGKFLFNWCDRPRDAFLAFLSSRTLI